MGNWEYIINLDNMDIYIYIPAGLLLRVSRLYIWELWTGMQYISDLAASVSI